jgi:hypothetical protein
LLQERLDAAFARAVLADRPHELRGGGLDSLAHPGAGIRRLGEFADERLLVREIQIVDVWNRAGSGRGLIGKAHRSASW